MVSVLGISGYFVECKESVCCESKNGQGSKVGEICPGSRLQKWSGGLFRGENSRVREGNWPGVSGSSGDGGVSKTAPLEGCRLGVYMGFIGGEDERR